LDDALSVASLLFPYRSALRFLALPTDSWARDVLIREGSDARGACHGACIARSA